MSRQRTIFGAVTACVPDDGSTAAASAGRRTARWIGLVRDPGARVDQVEADASVARDQLPAQRLGRVTGDGRGGRLQVGVSGPVAVPTLTFSCYASPAIAGSTVGRFDAVFASGFGWGGGPHPRLRQDGSRVRGRRWRLPHHEPSWLRHFCQGRWPGNLRRSATA